jgi:hypothetical protein
VQSQRFSVEFDRRTVGIAVGVPGGFIFYASDDRFEEIHGRLFPRARSIERALDQIAAKRKPEPFARLGASPAFAGAVS